MIRWVSYFAWFLHKIGFFVQFLLFSELVIVLLVDFLNTLLVGFSWENPSDFGATDIRGAEGSRGEAFPCICAAWRNVEKHCWQAQETCKYNYWSGTFALNDSVLCPNILPGTGLIDKDQCKLNNTDWGWVSNICPQALCPPVEKTEQQISYHLNSFLVHARGIFFYRNLI